jgi:ribonuclease J
MASVTVLGGAGEIGGNKVLVEDRDGRLFLDFGMSLSARSSYFSDPYVSPRSERSLLELGIVPKLTGFYRWEKEVQFDCVFLSHAHLDHYGYLSLVSRDIPVYCGETTKIQMEAIAATRRGGFESDYEGLRYMTFRTGSSIRVGSITVKPVHVDHSLPGAYGFIVETSDGAVVYTGDMRAHGRMSSMTADFAAAAAGASPQLMLTEGTNIVSGSVSSEAEVAEKLGSVIGRSRGLVVVSFSTMDTDRLLSFYEAARKNERKLVLSLRQAYMLSRLEGDRGLRLPSIGEEGIAVYRRKKKRYEEWEESVCSRSHVVTAKEVAGEQDKYVLAAGLSDMEAMLEVRPVEGSVYVLSSSEPFNEEMELDMQRLVMWLDNLGMPQYHIHVSGHIMPQDLREILLDVSPKRIVPIHTEHPGLFSKYVGEGKGIVVPVMGERIEIG